MCVETRMRPPAIHTPADDTSTNKHTILVRIKGGRRFRESSRLQEEWRAEVLPVGAGILPAQIGDHLAAVGERRAGIGRPEGELQPLHLAHDPGPYFAAPEEM